MTEANESILLRSWTPLNTNDLWGNLSSSSTKRLKEKIRIEKLSNTALEGVLNDYHCILKDREDFWGLSGLKQTKYTTLMKNPISGKQYVLKLSNEVTYNMLKLGDLVVCLYSSRPTKVFIVNKPDDAEVDTLWLGDALKFTSSHIFKGRDSCTEIEGEPSRGQSSLARSAFIHNRSAFFVDDNESIVEIMLGGNLSGQITERSIKSSQLIADICPGSSHSTIFARTVTQAVQKFSFDKASNEWKLVKEQVLMAGEVDPMIKSSSGCICLGPARRIFTSCVQTKSKMFVLMLNGVTLKEIDRTCILTSEQKPLQYKGNYLSHICWLKTKRYHFILCLFRDSRVMVLSVAARKLAIVHEKLCSPHLNAYGICIDGRSLFTVYGIKFVESYRLVY
jgi:hypothetical protein